MEGCLQGITLAGESGREKASGQSPVWPPKAILSYIRPAILKLG